MLELSKHSMRAGGSGQAQQLGQLPKRAASPLVLADLP
jgi:hypothetical protein